MSRLGGAGRGLTRLTRAKNVPSFTSRTSGKATNRVFKPLQALQSSKTGFLCHCRRCNCPESDSGGFARSAMAQNQILEDLHGLQWLRIRFWRICTVCNGSESDSGRIAWSAMAQNQILEDLHGLQWLRIRFWRICTVCNGPESDSGVPCAQTSGWRWAPPAACRGGAMRLL